MNDKGKLSLSPIGEQTAPRMQLLLIDNHDSFSAILHHYLWELSGVRPLFFRNDALTREALRALCFDAAVFSPGPGHPALARDFGICSDVLELHPGLPILGVCLGHQGLAHFGGGRVIADPGARHGRASPIRHDGQGLFRGLPQGFSAIRYHSLVVEESSLPSNIQATAWSDDGRVMGLRFRDRPWLGVQFHPESVGTQHGKSLLANFLDLARPARARPAPPDLPAWPPAPAGEKIRFHELAWREPAEVFSRHFASAPAAFWLDGAGWPSVCMGLSESLRVLRSDGMEIRRWDAPAGQWRSQFHSGDPLALYVEFLSTATRPGHADVPWPGYRGGPVGHFAYELQGRIMRGPSVPAPMGPEPLGRWLLPEAYLVFLPGEQRVFAAWEGGADPGWMRTLLAGWENDPPPVVEDGKTPLPDFSHWKPLLTQAEYACRIRDLQREISAGNTYEACLTHALSVRAEADPLEVFRVLRRRNPAPYAAYLAFPDVRILSSSPELFLELSPEGILRGRPMKGTRPRGRDAGEDLAAERDLRHHPKDRAENLMIVDLTRHDFCRVCSLGSVEVSSFLEVEKHPAVFQLVSEVRGRLAAGCSPAEAVWACFPGGSMTGAPKERTVELLSALEGAPRGIFSGALGYFTGASALQLSMVIRTLEHRDGEWRIGCGGAVLAESDPDSEWNEALVKARSVIDAVS